jgi:hypothetical protein
MEVVRFVGRFVFLCPIPELGVQLDMSNCSCPFSAASEATMNAGLTWVAIPLKNPIYSRALYLKSLFFFMIC